MCYKYKFCKLLYRIVLCIEFFWFCDQEKLTKASNKNINVPNSRKSKVWAYSRKQSLSQHHIPVVLNVKIIQQYDA